MKKKRNKIIIVLIMIILLYIGWKNNIKEHTVTYQVDNYQIKERFHKNQDYLYDMIITKKKNTYIYTINQKLDKQKKIIKKITTYKEKDVTCIIPTYKKEIETNIYCNLNNTQVSVDYLIKTNNKSFQKIRNKIKKYKIKYPTSSNTKKNYKNIEVYNKNILNNQVYVIWNYKGIILLDNENNTYQKILDYDLYDNVMACVVKNYYVLFENTSVNGIKTIYSYNLTKNKLKKIELKKPLSKNSYINGVINDKIYITDKKEKKEYTLEIEKEKLEEIDNEQTTYIVYKNNKKKELSKSDFFLKKQIFTYEEDYHYYLKENKLYKTIKTNTKNPVLLLELEDIKEWYVQKEEVILLKDGDIYSYTDQEGLRKILESNELKYNYKNIYKVGER